MTDTIEDRKYDKLVVNEAIRRLNLERRDLKELGNGALVTCKIEDLRYYRDTILRLQAALSAIIGGEGE